MFGLLRYNRKANGKEPERQKERTLEHARIQNQIAANASNILGQGRMTGPFVVILSEAKNL
jgi:hypothetical protein